jgi:hypothetical protein
MKQLAYCLMIMTLVLNAGCAVALIGAGAAGTVAYIRGDLTSTEPYEVSQVYQASQKAIADLGLARIKQSRDVLGAQIIARDALDKKITIKVKYHSEYSSKLSIRVAMFGSEEKSRQIYLKIRECLKDEYDSE